MMPFITLSTGRTITVITVLFNAYDENYWKCAACMRSPDAIRSSSSSSNDPLCFYGGPKSEAYKFFNNCVVPVIRLSNIAGIDAPNIAQKELIPLYDMISPVNRFVKIGIISLNERKDRYLCVYTDDRDIKTQISRGLGERYSK
jgi:hypothetical protein